MDGGPRRSATRTVVARCGSPHPPPLVVVEGAGGTGKTGLLQAVVAQRQRGALPTVVLRGRHGGHGEAPTARRPDLASLAPGTLVVVDDGHLLDEPTLVALAGLAEAAGDAAAEWGGPGDPGASGSAAGSGPAVSTPAALLVGTRPARRRPALACLFEQAAHDDLLVRLGPLDDDELAAGLADLLGAPPHHDLLVAVGRASAGSPLLASCLVRAWQDADLVSRGQLVAAPDLAAAAHTGVLAARLGQLSDDGRAALATLAVTGDRLVAQWLAVERAEAYAELVDWGLALAGGGVPPLVAEAARRLLEPGERARGEELAATLEARAGGAPEQLAGRLWRSGSTTSSAATAYRAAGDHLLTTRPRAAVEWYRRARVADPDDGPARLGLLHATLAAGDGRRALAQAEELRQQGDVAPALAAAAAVYASRGLWSDAALRLERAAADEGSNRRKWWTAQQSLCRLLGGTAPAPPAAEDTGAGIDADLGVDAATTLANRVAAAVVASTGAERAHVEATRRLLREVAALGGAVELPPDTAISPHEAGAALALAAGEVSMARRLLAAAPTYGLRAPAVARLAAWAELRAGGGGGGGGDGPRSGGDGVRGGAGDNGRGDGRAATDGSGAGQEPGAQDPASAATAGRTGGGANRTATVAGSPVTADRPGPPGGTPTGAPTAESGGLPAADGAGDGTGEEADLVGVSLEAVAAHRAGDVAGGAVAARRLAATLPSGAVDLTNFDPVCELIVLARRFGPAPLAAELEGRLSDLLGGLGWPPLWTARFRWARLEAAVATRDVAELTGAAEALARMAEAVPSVAPLAGAAAVWQEVMAGQPDQQRVEQAVAALQDAGLAWEASQLAGQAAIRIDDAAAAKSLLGRARALRGEAGGGGRDDSDRPLTRAGLSEREVEVARLVLDGLTHRDIGATLYISPKTVEHHVAHIRTKLGVTNRAEFLASLREDLAARVD